MSAQPHTPGKLEIGPTIFRHMIAELRSKAEDRPIAQVWETRDEWPKGPRTPRGFADAERLMACWNACEGIADPQATITALREALKALTIDANRLCDRNTGGSYEDDCRRSLEQARAALALVPPAAKET